MTPAARVQAAIDVLAPVLRGAPAERELLAWSRRSRFAGSKDRAAVRDHVFDALRRLRSSAWIGGEGDVPLTDMEARAVLAGCLAGQGASIADLFDGSRHGPVAWTDFTAADLSDAPDGVRWDLPDWLLPRLQAALGADLSAVATLLRDRAPVHLRARGDRAALIETLKAAGYDAAPHALTETAIAIGGAPRGLANLPQFAAGAFEFQDAGSQALVDRLPLLPGGRILDLCAGGGGKTLALAARTGGRIHAHDADPDRLRDLPARAKRAGADIVVTNDPEAAGPFDLVVCDVPCSGSGAWRRQPEARWRLTPARLAQLGQVQTDILARARALTRPGGHVAYMTCSLLTEENGELVRADAARSGWQITDEWSSSPMDGADGFYLAILTR